MPISPAPVRGIIFFPIPLLFRRTQEGGANQGENQIGNQRAEADIA